MRKLLLLALLPMMLAACSMYQPVSNQSGTILQATLPPDRFSIIGTGEGTSCASFFLGIPTGAVTGEKNTYQSAVRKAIHSKNGDHFIQSTADMTFTYFPSLWFPFYQEVCTTVEGLVVKLK